MTKERPPNPQPTSDTPYSVYLWPRSKNPDLNWIYDWLAEHNWRFDATTMLWHTPEKDQLQGVGSLEYAPDGAWFRIQPPSVEGDDGMPHRSAPLLLVER